MLEKLLPLVLYLTLFNLMSVCVSYSSEMPTLYEYYTQGGIKSGLEASGDRFRLNGKEITIFGGSFHYFRVHQNNWRHILRKFKAAGLNSVSDVLFIIL